MSDPVPTPLIWRIATPIVYLFTLVSTIYYTIHRPHSGAHPHRTIWRQNSAHHTPFALNAPLTSIYWLVLFLLQLIYVSLLALSRAPPSGVALAPTFTAHNILVLAFVHLYTRTLLWWALLLAALDFVLLTFAYFRYSLSAVRATAAKAPLSDRLVHFAALAGPLAFAFVALYWDGAAAAHARHFAARVVANVFVWSWGAYGGFYLVAFGDWTLAFCLSVLCACKSAILIAIMCSDGSQPSASRSLQPLPSRCSGSLPSSSWPCCSWGPSPSPSRASPGSLRCPSGRAAAPSRTTGSMRRCWLMSRPKPVAFHWSD
jgi:hypothetical protein